MGRKKAKGGKTQGGRFSNSRKEVSKKRTYRKLKKREGGSWAPGAGRKAGQSMVQKGP